MGDTNPFGRSEWRIHSTIPYTLNLNGIFTVAIGSKLPFSQQFSTYLGSSQVIAQYYQLIRLGYEGYKKCYGEL
ncbi:hypothetical protein NC653_010879 [Populus alba x Populus x berolinensis]|uniref:Uncharacterized protein n=1 Tax=Populus alba x Populus x berolinensis TaxID=444605 RepID=A0AAD6W6V9_9ROSI|nr:hypothetical protein NC653_010879 [Populus alba x Populus x berolinensis]